MKTEDPALYHAVENNTLLNDVFFYVLHLPQLQNMHEYMVPAQDIDGAEGDIVDVPAGEAVHSQSFAMSGDEEEEESAAPAAAAAAAPAAAAERGSDGAGPPAAGGPVDA